MDFCWTVRVLFFFFPLSSSERKIMQAVLPELYLQGLSRQEMIMIKDSLADKSRWSVKKILLLAGNVE